MRILVCLDESELSRAILPPVRRLAAASSAQVDIGHVLEFQGRSQAEEAATTRRVLEGVLEGFPADARTVVLHGTTASAVLIDYAAEHEIDIIAMASHVRPSVAEAILGSTTRSVLRSGVAPVLVVHPTH